jgi:glycine/D-amino acid oxidase-like deaminating enzyme
MRVVICGGGVIGAATAHFLSRRGVAPLVVEPVGVACGASGKSGGFLALDWCDGTPLQALARRSFALHACLTEELGGDWGYRRLDTYGGFGDAADRGGRKGALAWLSERVAVGRRLGTTATTAQIEPAAFTLALMQAAEAEGARLRHGRGTGLVRRNGAVEGVIVDGETIAADAVVIAMGPWSVLAAEWLPLPPVFGLKGHSIVFDTGGKLPAEALFLEYREANGATSSPEIFPRANGTTYVCAISSESPLPIDPANVRPDDGAIPRLRAICRDISPILASAKILAEQACYRPVTGDGLPLIGAVPSVGGAYIATGHSVWGMLNAPATGEAMAELILDGAARTVDLAPFDPGRLLPRRPHGR